MHFKPRRLCLFALCLFIAILFFCSLLLAANHTIEKSVAELIDSSPFATAQWGIYIIDQKTRESLYEMNSHKRFIPASVTKIFTAAAAINAFNPDFRFRTSVYVDNDPEDGLLEGNVYLFGRGDPLLTTDSLCTLAKQLYEKGVRCITGKVVADDSAFLRTQLPCHAEWEDLTWYYTPEISALSLDGNALSLTIEPSQNENEPPYLSLSQQISYCYIKNSAKTVKELPSKSPHNLIIERGFNNNEILISGEIAIGSAAVHEKIALHLPAEYARLIFIKQLKSLGIAVSEESYPKPMPEISYYKEIAFIESPTLDIILQKMNKDSDNLTAELLIRAVGKSKNPNGNTLQEGRNALKQFLNQLSIDASSLVLHDGSGLSRHNGVSPFQTVCLLQNMQDNDVFVGSLPIAGVDGCLKNRFKETFAEGKVKAKTGGMSNIASLAGYASTPTGRKVIFAIYVNNYLEWDKDLPAHQFLDKVLLRILSAY